MRLYLNLYVLQITLDILPDYLPGTFGRNPSMSDETRQGDNQQRRAPRKAQAFDGKMKYCDKCSYLCHRLRIFEVEGVAQCAQ